MRIDLVGTTADFRGFGPRPSLPINHLLCENRQTAGRIGEDGLASPIQAEAIWSALQPIWGIWPTAFLADNHLLPENRQTAGRNRRRRVKTAGQRGTGRAESDSFPMIVVSSPENGPIAVIAGSGIGLMNRRRMMRRDLRVLAAAGVLFFYPWRRHQRKIKVEFLKSPISPVRRACRCLRNRRRRQPADDGVFNNLVVFKQNVPQNTLSRSCPSSQPVGPGTKKAPS